MNLESEFQRLDSIIASGAKTFMDVGLALVEMHKGRFYLKQFPTFEAYAESRGIKRQSAYRLIEAVQLTLELEACPNSDTHRARINIGLLKSSSANAVSKLKRVPKEKRIKVLNLAAEYSHGAPLTGPIIEAAAAQVAHRPAPSSKITLAQCQAELDELERKVNAACLGDQKQREAFGKLVNGLASRLLNPVRSGFFAYGR